MALIRTKVIKHQMARKYNSKVVGRKFNEGDLVLCRAEKQLTKGKLALNWDGPFRVIRSLDNGAYKLFELVGKEIPQTWYTTKLRRYFS